MGCRVPYCIGGGCVPTTTDVSQWMAAFGYTFDPNDPLAQDYQNVIAEAPAELQSQEAWRALCEACMRSRAMLFCNQSPGDSGTTQTAAASSNALGVSLGSSLGTEAGIGETAATGLSIALPGAGAIAGAALDEVLSLFQHHAQAEAAQSTALSSLSPQITQAIRQADLAVASGSDSADSAVAFLNSIYGEMIASDASLTKSCNAFCWYNNIMECIVKISPYFYALIAPASTVSENISNGLSPSPSEAVQANEVLGSGLSIGGANISSGTILIVLVVAAIVFLISGTKRTEIVRA